MLPGDGLGDVGGDGEVAGQDVDALGAGHVQQNAAAHNGGHAFNAVLGHSAAAGLWTLGRFEPAAHNSIAREVGKRVEMRAGVAAHDDQLVGRAEASRAHGVAVAPLQGEHVGRMRRVHRHTHVVGRAEVEYLPIHDRLEHGRIHGWASGADGFRILPVRVEAGKRA